MYLIRLTRLYPLLCLVPELLYHSHTLWTFHSGGSRRNSRVCEVNLGHDQEAAVAHSGCKIDLASPRTMPWERLQAHSGCKIDPASPRTTPWGRLQARDHTERQGNSWGIGVYRWPGDVPHQHKVIRERGQQWFGAHDSAQVHCLCD